MKKLAEEVAKDAKAEAKQIVAQAKEEASSIMEKAQAEADAIRAGASAKAEKEAKQVSREVVASANQAMQMDILIAKKEALDATLANAKEILADAGWKKRSSLKTNFPLSVQKIFLMIGSPITRVNQDNRFLFKNHLGKVFF